jgi:hypothetical protein
VSAILVPLALGETWFAVFGGLIPIVGLGLIALVLWHAAKPPKDENSDREGPT